jgi:DNA replication and repair protein RecF
MNITQLQLKNFRNYTDLSLGFDQGVHVFFGCNAQGKTNLLEAIFLAVLGKSFRAGNDDELIRWNTDESNLCIDFQNRIADHSLRFRLKREGNRENFLNEQPVKKKEIIGFLNAVFFSPEDLWLVKGSPAVRRRFLDFEISQVNPPYYQALLQYNRALYQRNHLLKQINDGYAKRNMIDIWDEELIVLADKLVAQRIASSCQLSDIAHRIHHKITNGAEDFSAHYFVFGKAEEKEADYKIWYGETLKVSRERDIRRGSTEIGPHKDDLNFTINNYDGKTFASQGQQRTIVLSLKLAEIELMHQQLGEYPLLLLDDVMSELDEKRRVNLIEEIDGKVQTFVTGTEKINALRGLKPTYYSVDCGAVCQRNVSWDL